MIAHLLCVRTADEATSSWCGAYEAGKVVRPKRSSLGSCYPHRGSLEVALPSLGAARGQVTAADARSSSAMASVMGMSFFNKKHKKNFIQNPLQEVVRQLFFCLKWCLGLEIQIEWSHHKPTRIEPARSGPSRPAYPPSCLSLILLSKSNPLR